MFSIILRKMLSATFLTKIRVKTAACDGLYYLFDFLSLCTTCLFSSTDGWYKALNFLKKLYFGFSLYISSTYST